MATYNNTNIENIKNKIEVPVIDRHGNVIEMREMRNILFPQLHPGLDVAIVDWKHGAGRNWHPDAATIEAPINDTRLPEQQMQPGLPWHAGWAWGSSVKGGKTIALKTDIVTEDGFAFKGEDALRYGRAKLAMGNWGLARWKKCVVMAVPEGTKFGQHIVADGVGLICSDDAEQIRLNDGGHLKIQMRPDGQSSQVSQRISFAKYPQAREEVFAAKREQMQALLDPNAKTGLYRRSILRGEEGMYRRDLARINDEMLRHPYVNFAWSANARTRLRRLATALPLESRMFVMVPADVRYDTINYPHILGRFPIETYGQIGASDGKLNKAEKAEAERVAGMEVCQVSLWMENKFFSKGNLQMVDRSVLPAGVDIIVCAKDIKMVKGGDSKKLGKIHKKGAGFTGTLWLTMVQMWAKGQAIGVNVEVGVKKFNCDFDGDLAQVSDTSETPGIHAAVKDLPVWSQAKLNKTTNPMSSRSKLAANAMWDVVGPATNMMSATFAWAERDIMAVMLGKKGEEELEHDCGRRIKEGTDGWKGDYDMEHTSRDVAITNKRIEGLLGGVYPPNRWKNNPVLFSHKVPLVEGYAPHDAIWAAMTDEQRKEMDDAGGWLRKGLNGTVPEIARFVLPDLMNLIEVGSEVNLLSFYLDWAPDVASPKTREVVDTVIQHYGSTVQRVNFSDMAEAAAFKHNFIEYCDAAVKIAGCTREQFAWALWRQAHSSREATSRGGAIFMGMPEESKKIAADMPGKKLAAAKAAPVKMMGFDIVMADPNTPRKGVAVAVRVINYKGVNRSAVVALRPLPGQKQPTGGLPINCLGLIAKECAQPAEGEYAADIERVGQNKCWLVTLK